MRRLLLSAAVGLLVGLAAAPISRAQEQPLVWEVVGEPLNEFDGYVDAEDAFLAGDTAVYATGVEGLFVLHPGETAWTLLIEHIRHAAVYASSTGALFAISRGMVRSTDNGQTWGDFIDDVVAVLELPSGVLIAAEIGCCGIARSTDEGATWTLVDLGGMITPEYPPEGLAYAPPSPRRAEGRLVAVGRDGAAYSTDEGLTWAPSNLVESFGFLGRTAIYSEYDDTLYAMINGDPGDGGTTTGLVWASADGEMWELRGRVPTGGDESPGQIVAGAEGGLWAIIPGSIDGAVYASADGGRTWVSRGEIDGEALVGNTLRLMRLRMGPGGRLWLATIDGLGGPGPTGAVLRTVEPVVVASEAGPGKHGESALGAAYPNPSRSRVTVPLVLDAAAEVRVTVYDLLGRAVAVLHEGRLAAGRRRFSLDGAALPAGVYLVRAEVGGQWFTERVTVMR